MKRVLMLLTVPFYSLGAITPDIALPDGFSEQNFEKIILRKGDYFAHNTVCEGISFKKFYSPEHKSYPLFEPLLCLFTIDVINDGYGPGRLIPEKVYFDKKSNLWKKKKYTLSKELTKDSLKSYGINSLKELHPLELYNIQSVNARGYAVINSNIPLHEKRQGVKKRISFCLLYEGGMAAFCGYGPLTKQADGKETDFTPYLLKSLETVEMGLPERPGQ